MTCNQNRIIALDAISRCAFRPASGAAIHAAENIGMCITASVGAGGKNAQADSVII